MEDSATGTKIIMTLGLIFCMFNIKSCIEDRHERRNLQASAITQTYKSENVSEPYARKTSESDKKIRKPIYCKKSKFKQMSGKYRIYCK